MAEVAAYTREDHLFRGADEYAAAKYDITIDWLRLRDPSRVGRRLANVGCGSGEFNLRAAALGLEVVACEPEVGAHRLAVAASATVPGVRVWPLDLEGFAAAAPRADFLVMHDVLEHIEDERRAISALARLLLPGGEAVLSVPAFDWLFGFHDRQLGHFRRYTRRRLLQLFEPGWRVLAARYYGSLFVPATLVYSRWLARPYPIREVASAPWKRRALRLACQLQRAVAEPFGTSVMVHLRRGPDPLV